MNIGVDIGNITSVACGEETCIIESRVQPSSIEEMQLRNKDVFSFDNDFLTLNKGDFESEIYKYKKNNFNKLLYRSMSKCTDDCINNVCIGIPAKQFKNKKAIEEFIEVLNKNRIHTINDKTIIINKIKIVPEGYGLKMLGYLTEYDEYEELQEGVPTLVIDMGGETTDLILFDENCDFLTAENISHGLLKIYEQARNYLEYNREMTITKADAKKYFDGDRNLRLSDKEKANNITLDDVNNYRQPIVIDAIRELLNGIKNYFPSVSEYNLLLCGGGAEVIYDVLKQIYEQTILVSDITFNAEGNKVLADLLWEEENEEIELVEEVRSLLNEMWRNRHLEENQKLLSNLFRNEQGSKILKRMFNVKCIDDITRNFSPKEYIKENYLGI